MFLHAAGLSYSITIISFTTCLNGLGLYNGSTSMTLYMVQTYSLQLLASLTPANSPSTN